MSFMICLPIVEINFSLKFNFFKAMFNLVGIIQNNGRERNVQENIAQNPQLLAI